MNFREFVSNLLEKLRSNSVGAVLARGFSGVALVKVGGAALGFLSHIVLARVMSVTNYGIYIYVWTWLMVLVLVARAGFDNLLIRYVAKYRAEQSWRLLKGLLRRSVQTVGGIAVILGGIAAVVVMLVGQRISSEMQATFMAGFILLPILALVYIRQSTLRGLKCVARANVPELIVRHLLVIGLAAGVWTLTGTLQAWQAMVATIAAFLVALVVAETMVRMAAPAPTFDVRIELPDEPWIRKALPFLILASAGLLQKKTDVIMLGFFVPAAEIGIYGAALRLTALVGFGMVVVNLTVTPYFSEYYTAGEEDKLQKLATLSAAGIATFTTAVAVALLLFGDTVLAIFGREFTGGYSILAVLVLGKMFAAFCGPVALIMMMTDQESAASKVEGVAAVLNVVLNAVAIPLFGALGAAVATAASLSIRNIIFAYFVYTRLDLNPTVLNPDIVRQLRNI